MDIQKREGILCINCMVRLLLNNVCFSPGIKPQEIPPLPHNTQKYSTKYVGFIHRLINRQIYMGTALNSGISLGLIGRHTGIMYNVKEQAILHVVNHLFLHASKIGAFFGYKMGNVQCRYVHIFTKW